MDARARLRERLAQGPILADGAMGTLLFSRGIPQRASLDELVATRPDLIGAIHREYLDAGADLIETATFGANRIRLGPHGLSDQAGRFARRAPRSPARRATWPVATCWSRARSGRSVARPRTCCDWAMPRSGLPFARHRRPARGRRRPLPVRDVLAARPPRDRDRGGACRVRRPADHRDAHVRRGRRAARRHAAVRGREPARRHGRRRHRRELRRRTAGLPRRAVGDGRHVPGDHPERGPAAAHRGPVRLRRRAGLPGRHDRPVRGRGCRDRRWLLRDDAGPHPGDAHRTRRAGPRSRVPSRPSRRAGPAR